MEPVTWHRTPPLIAVYLIYYADQVNRVTVAYWVVPRVNSQFWVVSCPCGGCSSLLSIWNRLLLPAPTLLPQWPYRFWVQLPLTCYLLLPVIHLLFSVDLWLMEWSCVIKKTHHHQHAYADKLTIVFVNIYCHFTN